MNHPLSLLSRLAFGAALTASAAALVAQSAPPLPSGREEEVVRLDAFTVTGSNVRRVESEKALPVTVMRSEDMELRDASQPADLLAALPQVTGLPGNEAATFGATARGDNANISLRGLPSSNTLVLLDGRRLVPHPISQTEAGVPTLSTNVNQLPNRGVERVEVLRDGASSIYGTDAVTGVVNYITRRDYVGTELVTRYGQTEIGDGREWRGTLTHGRAFASGKGHVQVVLDVYDRQAIFARDRDFMAEADMSSRAPAPWNVSTETTFNARSASSAYGFFQTGSVAADGTFTGKRPSGVSSTLTSSSGNFYLVPTTTGVGFQTSSPSRTGITSTYYWNNNTYRVLQPRTTRYNGFVNATYDLTPQVTLFADLNAYHARSVTYREPDALSSSSDGTFVVPATNPWNPFGTRYWHVTGAPNADGTARLTGTPSAVLIRNKRFTDLDDRIATVTNDAFRGVFGARGRLLDTWTWETAALHSIGRTRDDEAGATRKSLLQAALNQTDPTLAFNPFGRTFAVQGGTIAVTGDYANPESVQQTFRSAFVREGETGLSSLDVRASGEALRLWGGNALGMAFGAEYRYERYSDYRPPYAGLNPADSGLDPTDNDFLSFSANANTDGKRHVAAVYVETVVPVVGRDFRLPLVEALEFSVSARHERYTDFGSTTKPKLGVTWRPHRRLLVRASYNEGFHAPNLAQLFTGTLNRIAVSTTDTYRSAVTGLTTDGASNRRTVASGNRELQPEESIGKSVGVVWEVPRVKGLSLGADYWEIRQTDVIASSGTAAENISADSVSLRAATAAALAQGAGIGSIDLGSGSAAYLGDASVVRLAVTDADRAAFAAYNATRSPGNQRAAVGAIDYVRITYFNRAQQFVNGFDVDATYRLGRTPLGSFTLATTWTFLNDFHAYNAAGAARTELRETNNSAVGGASPKWRGTAALSWKRGAWGAGVSAYYIGHYIDSGADTTAATYEALGRPSYIVPFLTNGVTEYRYQVDDSISTNAFVTYRITARQAWLRDTTVRVGVINAFNAIPPLSSDSRGYDPALYNQLARGRTWSVQLTRKF
ncbi:TonB-dependent receptor [Opitutus sp. ER46]|uniref:TonB-dependent receptor domain-containing protein n=1 Tax=Opitutus sp. ER46 TaxID=2161864 RepID=UPI000D300798|nr:TonB-dependent receptor [Opitutus sp. ER46]PTX98570.1 hypothetical protein DB354_04715 [Opitutus sp. ER46]